MFSFHYLVDAPIISVVGNPGLGGNINGPSLIKTPDWVKNPPAKYLLYFAHHCGHAIKLAVSDSLLGPWHVYDRDPLKLEDSLFAIDPPAEDELDAEALAFIAAGADGNYPHIASPDVHVDAEARQIRLYYHGRMHNGLQRSRLALSDDGLSFIARPEILADPYLRIFQHDDWCYGLSMPARLYRSPDGLSGFDKGPRIMDASIRHHAILNFESRWYIFWTRVHDTPERILVTELVTDGDWQNWRSGTTAEVHRAIRPWEGSDLPADASAYGAIMNRANQLRDPAIFEEDGRIYLLYAIAGEQGIAIGELKT